MSVRDALRSAPMATDVPGLRLLQVGDHWDFVRTPADLGFLALAHLRTTGVPIGPVLYDGPNERLYYAIRTGTTGHWNDRSVRLISNNSWLVAPGLELMDDWFGGWCELPDDETLTDTDALLDALQHPYIAVSRPSSSVLFR
ncbi:hypothetical protein F9278_26145 [Streptomyces phaeolivaceus]|uniref:Uncharacterized protein n=1 Tax=Streptomyces phaeolivaceus TaxID=2653200 RepID=A0A5P8K937_9ACTN|nr:MULTISPECIES: hypothetical protein [Streptomyces]MDX3067124.1 hypothetical protein [Streptomyces sp. ND04-05B]QFQ99049.1 hypothetical protein F9278_26145 [Streptomyces phaeolivaceus]